MNHLNGKFDLVVSRKCRNGFGDLLQPSDDENIPLPELNLDRRQHRMGSADEDRLGL
jgi:hypothetical protein